MNNVRKTETPVIVALDYPDERSSLAMVDRLDPDMCRLKVGKELFTRCGPALVGRLQDRGFDVFLDLKFHDIPNTAAAAVTAAADLGVWMVNVHASGGEAMMRACREALQPFGRQRPRLIAVTVLTSMGPADLAGIGVSDSPAEQVARLAKLTRTAGLDGVVCSALEAPWLRETHGSDFTLVTPGIRPADSERGDQQRVMTPEAAVEAGSDYLVIGRPVTRAEDPQAALQAIYRSLV